MQSDWRRRREEHSTLNYFSAFLRCSLTSYIRFSIRPLCPPSEIFKYSEMSLKIDPKEHEASLYVTTESVTVLWLQSGLKIANNQLCMKPAWHGCWIILQQSLEWKLKKKNRKQTAGISPLLSHSKNQLDDKETWQHVNKMRKSEH